MACSDDAEREPAERRNLAALKTIEVPGGPVALRTETIGQHRPDTSEGPIVGWKTTREYRLPRPRPATAVIDRATRALRRAGWRVGTAGSFWLNAQRGRSCVHLLTDDGSRARGVIVSVNDCSD